MTKIKLSIDVNMSRIWMAEEVNMTTVQLLVSAGRQCSVNVCDQPNCGHVDFSSHQNYGHVDVSRKLNSGHVDVARKPNFGHVDVYREPFIKRISAPKAE